MTLRTHIKVPIKIITPRIAKNKQDSIFYAGKNIAEVQIRNRTYVLTTAGEYKFSLDGRRRREERRRGSSLISFDSHRMIGAGAPGHTRYNALSKLTDKKIKTLGDRGLVENWGWFGINVWEKRPDIPGLPPGKDQCLLDCTDVWSEYDEALNAFIEFVEKDLTK